jgi:integrase
VENLWSFSVAIHLIKPSSVAELIDNQPGKHPDGGGLYLQVGAPGQASWIFRHRNKWRSFGPADIVNITEARDRALALRKAANAGQCPIAMLDGGATAATGKTFEEAKADYLAEKEWKASNRARELRRYELLFAEIPWFTALPLAAITQDHKNKAVAHFPLGTTKRKLAFIYIKAILSFAEDGTMKRGKKRGGGTVKHHEAMPWCDVPAFYQRLSKLDSVDARALQFTILTTLRTSEVIGEKAKAPATWGEIGEEDGKPVWIVPAERMKASREHRVPLTPQMMKVLGKKQAPDVPLFKVSSQSAMLDTLRSLDGNGYKVHGFRASFETWGQEATNFPRDLVKLCTAHDKRSATDKAYQRSDLLEKRREIMTAWSDYVTGANL